MLELEKKELSKLSVSTNELLEAMTIVADSVVKAQAYDKTIEAKIVSAARKEEGLYKVEYENAIFDAYSADGRYAENEIVYVHIPGGDFTKQKHIVGRKVDLEAAPDRTFNFRMPFDDFVGLESLTAKSLYVYGNKGFLANYPAHGSDFQVDDTYINEIKPLQQTIENEDHKYNIDIDACDQEVARLKGLLDTTFLMNTYSLQPYCPGHQMTNYPYNGTQSYYDIIYDAFEHGEMSDTIKGYFQAYKNLINSSGTTNQVITYGSEDEKDFYKAIDSFEETTKAQIKANWLDTRNGLIADANALLEAYTGDANYNHIWTWVNDSQNRTPLIETKLGIQLDVQTLLGNYRPTKGSYGLKIRITGRTKNTEEDPSVTKTEEILWTNSEMYGNTYAFAVPYNQQRIFDISGYLWLDRIDIFFYQDNNATAILREPVDGNTQYISYNFIDEQGKVIPYEAEYINPDGSHDLLPYNIYFDNLEVLLGLTTDECSTDRVFLYTYDNIQFGYNPETQVDEGNPVRELQFAWVHKTENNGIVLVNHVEPEYTGDLHALKTFKASIYWYHHILGVAQDTTDIRQRYAGVNWQFMNDYDSDDEVQNINVTYHKHYNDDNEEVKDYDVFKCNVRLDAGKVKERFKACVVCKDVPYMTEPVIFSNYDQSLYSEADTMINEVTFRLLREAVDDQGNITIIEDNSLGNFFVYDEQNVSIVNDDNIKWSNIWFYIQVWMRNNDTGEYYPMPLVIDNYWEANNFEIEWQLPNIANSMLTNISQVTDRDLENSVLAPTVASNTEQFNEAIRSCTRKFKIQDYWDLRKTDNTIAAVVKRKTKTYRPQKEFMFGQSGTMGSQHTVVIYQDAPETPAMVMNEARFQVRATVYDPSGREVPNKNYIFSWELLSPTMMTESQREPIPSDATYSSQFAKIVSAAQDDGKGNSKNVLTGFIRNDNPLVLRVTVYNTGDEWYHHGIMQTRAFKLVDDKPTNALYRINCLNKIEFRSDGKCPLTIGSTIETYRIAEGDSENKTMWYPEWTLTQYKRSTPSSVNWGNPLSEPKYIGLKRKTATSYSVNTNKLDFVWYKKASDGSPDFSANPVFTKVRDNVHTENVTYQMMKDYIDLAYANDKAGPNSSTADETYNNRLELLNSTAGTIIPGHYEYSIDPYVDYISGNKAPWYWEEDMGDLYYTVIGFTEGSQWFKQAIAFTHNVYSSSLINGWDGNTLELDEKNSAVLAKMISAGSKDGENRFTGVIMGNWSKNGDSSLELPGLYGLNYGEQVFGFKTDGSGFIGKSGRGRIEFNGNQSLISNVDRTCYVNLDPIRFNILEDGSISYMGDYQGYSQYFLYAKTKKSTDTYDFTNLPDTLTKISCWTEKFMSDANNDYFIVDPNNGILTSGGIIARYGKIGNWLISSAGLYQYHQPTHTDPDDTDYRYMYLGYADLNPAEINEIKNRYKVTRQALEVRRKLAIETIKTKYVNEEFRIVGQYYAKIFQYDPKHYWNEGWPVGIALNVLNAVIDNYNGESTALLDDETSIYESVLAKSGMTKENAIIYTLILRYGKIYVSKDDYVRNDHAHYEFDENGNITRVIPHQRTGGMGIYKKIINFCYYSGVSSNTDPATLDEDNNYTVALPNSGTWVTNKSETQSTITPQPSYYYSNQYNKPDKENYNPYTWMTSRGYSSSKKGLAYKNELLTVSFINELIEWCSVYYDYHLTCYNMQLEEMLNESRNQLGQSQWNQYLAKCNEFERLKLAEIEETNKLFDTMVSAVDKAEGRDISDKISSKDTEKYAVFAGYKPELDPLFSVNWRGAMSAREALIGYDSPWLVTDYGLTQTNNSGSIFMGNPDTPYSMENWVTFGDDILKYDSENNKINVYPNHREDSKTYSIYSLKNATSGDNIGPLAYGSSGKFAIQAGNVGGDRTIHFGVRMDGTLFADRGKIGGWLIGPHVLGDYENDTTSDSSKFRSKNGKEYIALDNSDDKHQIRLADSQIILDGVEGIIFIGKRVDGSNAYTTGELRLATHRLLGTSAGTYVYDDDTQENVNGGSKGGWSNSNGTMSWNSNASYSGSIPVAKDDNSGTQNDTVVTTTDGANYISSFSYYVHKLKAPSSSSGYTFTGNSFKIGENYNGNTLNTGIELVNGSLVKKSDGTAVNNSIRSILVPLVDGSYLGAKTKKWNLIADQVFAASIYQGDYLVATEKWVDDIIKAVWKSLTAVDQAAAIALARANAAISRIQKLISGNWEQQEYDPVTGEPIGTGNPFKIEKYIEPSDTTGSLAINVSFGGGSGQGQGQGSGQGSNEVSACFNGKTSTCKVTTTVTVDTEGLQKMIDDSFEEGWAAAIESAEVSDDGKSVTVTSPAGKTGTIDVTKAFEKGAKTAIESGSFKHTAGSYAMGKLTTQGYHSQTVTLTFSYGDYSNTDIARTISCTVEVPTGGSDDDSEE